MSLSQHLSFPSITSNSTSTSLFSQFSNWHDPPSAIIKGSIHYIINFVGVVEVLPKDNDKASIVREAVRELVNSPSKPETFKVMLEINIDEIKIIKGKTNKILFCHPLRKVYYCFFDKENPSYFCYIVLDDEKYKCFVMLRQEPNRCIFSTIQQACQLAHYREEDKVANAEIQLIKFRSKEAEFSNILFRESRNPPPIPTSPVPPRPSSSILSRLSICRAPSFTAPIINGNPFLYGMAAKADDSKDKNAVKSDEVFENVTCDIQVDHRLVHQTSEESPHPFMTPFLKYRRANSIEIDEDKTPIQTPGVVEGVTNSFQSVFINVPPMTSNLVPQHDEDDDDDTYMTPSIKYRAEIK